MMMMTMRMDKDKDVFVAVAATTSVLDVGSCGGVVGGGSVSSRPPVDTEYIV